MNVLIQGTRERTAPLGLAAHSASLLHPPPRSPPRSPAPAPQRPLPCGAGTWLQPPGLQDPSSSRCSIADGRRVRGGERRAESGGASCAPPLAHPRLPGGAPTTSLTHKLGSCGYSNRGRKNSHSLAHAHRGEHTYRGLELSPWPRARGLRTWAPTQPQPLSRCHRTAVNPPAAEESPENSSHTGSLQGDRTSPPREPLGHPTHQELPPSWLLCASQKRAQDAL